MFNPCVIIPVYNHPHVIEATVGKIRGLQLPVIIVDDGSEEGCARILQKLAASDDGVTLLVHDENGGKGAAMKSGLVLAESMHFSHAVQVDADGQHNLNDITVLLDIARQHCDAIVSGKPRYDESVPKLRLYSRYLTHVWVWINTLSLEIQDSMCGFRVYPLAASCELIRNTTLGDRMDFDTEILVKWHWQGRQVVQHATKVHYPANSISHFRGVRDNILISKMHAKLFFGMLLRLPSILFRRIQGQHKGAAG